MLHLVVWYSGPGQHDNTDSLEEDSQALINLERNIANLERSLSASQLLQTVTEPSSLWCWGRQFSIFSLRMEVIKV